MFTSSTAGRTYGPITVNRELANSDGGILKNYDTYAVQLVQTVMNASSGNSRSTGFSGLKGANERESTRTFLLSISKDTTVEQVEAAIAAAPNATLYQVMSLSPITTKGQDQRIAAGGLTLDSIAEKQVLRPSTGAAPTLTADGELQYRAIFLDENGREDEDEREMSASYTPASLAHYLAPSVPLVQSTANEAAAEAAREQGAPVAALVDNEDSL